MGDLRFSMLAGLFFSGMSFATVKFLGFNNTSFIAMSYGYILLASLLGLKLSEKRLNKIYIEVEDDIVKKIGKEKRFTLRERQ